MPVSDFFETRRASMSKVRAPSGTNTMTIVCDKNLAESALHVMLAASYLSHQPMTPQGVVAVLAYIGLAAIRLTEQDKENA